MQIELKGKNALVCGSTQGIGRAIAEEFARSGARVTLVARNEEKLKQVRDQLSGEGHSYLCADFSKPDELRNALAAAPNPFHILVNNTGGPPGGPITDAETNTFVSAFEQHLLCNHILVQHCLPSMKGSNYGRIINVISTSVKQPLNGLGVSNTIRGAVANWSKTLANELGSFGITVNNILPGATETERLSSIVSNKAGKTGKSEDEVSGQMLGVIPAGRFGKPEELAFAATFLASDKAAYINGTNVVVDGGRTSSL